MFRRDWTRKPNADVFEELVRHQWWTDADLLAGADGTVRTRGFKGQYTITATVGDRRMTVAARLSGPGTTLTLKLPAAK